MNKFTSIAALVLIIQFQIVSFAALPIYVGAGPLAGVGRLDGRALAEVTAGLDSASALLLDISVGDHGTNLDSDRAWILGYAVARKKPVYLIDSDRLKFEERLRRAFAALGAGHPTREPGGFKRLLDPDGYAIEEFGLWDNLMIDGAAHFSGKIHRSAEAALAAVRANRPMKLLKLRASPSARSAIYLAGPDVFLPDPIAAGAHKKRVSRTFGLRGIYPMDGEISPGATPSETAMRIYAANIRRLKMSMRGTVANMSTFRGDDMDQGTAFEMGFTFGKGRKVSGYSDEPIRLPLTLAADSVRASGFEIRKTFAAAVCDLALGTDPNCPTDVDGWFCQNILAARDQSSRSLVLAELNSSRSDALLGSTLNNQPSP